MIVLGLDPAIANFGWVAVRLDPRGAMLDEVLALGVFTTEKDGSLRYGLDDLRRCRELANALLGVVAEWQPSALCVELSAGAKDAHATKALAASRAIVATVAAAHDIEVAVCTPHQLKKAATGAGRAGKNEVQRAMDRIYGPVEWPRARKEHAADALGAVWACQGYGAIRKLRALAYRRAT